LAQRVIGHREDAAQRVERDYLRRTLHVADHALSQGKEPAVPRTRRGRLH